MPECFDKYADPSTWAENKLPLDIAAENKMPSLVEIPMSKKEVALNKTGATREVAYSAMVAGLTARSMTVDKFGEEHYTEDHSSRLKAAELISKLNGDLKENMVDNRVYNNVVNITSAELKKFTDIVSGMRDEIKNLRASGRQTGEIIDVESI